jgi:hypothetical protein
LLKIKASLLTTAEMVLQFLGICCISEGYWLYFARNFAELLEFIEAVPNGFAGAYL